MMKGRGWGRRPQGGTGNARMNQDEGQRMRKETPRRERKCQDGTQGLEHTAQELDH